ncbi:hypothetical protein [Desulfocicer niacini]
MENIYETSRLVYLSLAYSNGNKRIITEHQTELMELLQRFQAEDAFRQAVMENLRAMELQLLEVEPMALRLSSRNSGSFFATTLTDYGRMLARTPLKAGELLCVHCAVATAFFPTESDLDAPVEDLGVIVPGDVVEILRQFAKAEERMDPEDEIFHPEVRTAAGRLRQLPEENPDSKRAVGGNSWLELIIRVLEHLVATGYLLEFQEQGDEVVEYRPTPAYQSAMRTAAVYAFHAFRELVADQKAVVSAGKDREASPRDPSGEMSNV